MVGFKLDLKGNKGNNNRNNGKSNDGSKRGAGPLSFGLKKKGPETSKKRAFGLSDSEDEDGDENGNGKKQAVAISSFGRKGAVVKKPSGQLGVLAAKKQPLVIKMEPSARRTFTSSEDDQARLSILTGEQSNHKEDDDAFTIDINRKHGIGMNSDNTRFQSTEVNDSDDETTYDDVPVAAFGEALLRGMGWKPTPRKDGAKSSEAGNLTEMEVEHRQRGVVLGIGAKAVEEELMNELMGKKGQLVEVPLKRVKKK